MLLATILHTNLRESDETHDVLTMNFHLTFDFDKLYGAFNCSSFEGLTLAGFRVGCKLFPVQNVVN